MLLAGEAGTGAIELETELGSDGLDDADGGCDELAALSGDRACNISVGAGAPDSLRSTRGRFAAVAIGVIIGEEAESSDEERTR